MDSSNNDAGHIGSLSNEKEKDISDRFKFLWEQYTKVVNLTITLTTGTLLLFLNISFTDKISQSMSLVSKSFQLCGYSSAVFLLFGLMTAIVWRVLTQIYMEREVFGKSEVVVQYLKEAGIYDNYKYAFEKKTSHLHRIIWVLSRRATHLFLVLGWLLFMMFLIGFVKASLG